MEDMCVRMMKACADADYSVVQELMETHVAGFTLVDELIDPALARLRRPERADSNNVTPLKRT